MLDIKDRPIARLAIAETLVVAVLAVPLLLKSTAHVIEASPLSASPTRILNVQVQPNHTYYVDDTEQLHIVGEVLNRQTVAGEPVIQADLLDNAGELIDGNEAPALAVDSTSLVETGGRRCFDVVFDVQPPDWVTYQLSINSFSTTGNASVASLRVSTLSTGTLPNGNYQIIGRVRNDGTDTLRNPQVQATLYNTANQVIGCAAGRANSSQLAPGRTSTFKVIFTGQRFSAAASYQLHASGEKTVSQPTPTATATHPRRRTTVTAMPTVTAMLTTTPTPQSCNSGNPDWRGSNSNYPFCVRNDMNWTDGATPVRYFNLGQDTNIGVWWNVYRVAGVWVMIEPNGDQCGPAGTGSHSVAVDGAGSYTWNVKDFSRGGYKVSLRILRNDGVEVRHNEKYMCIGIGTSSISTPTITAVPLTATGMPTEVPLPPTATIVPTDPLPLTTSTPQP